MEDNKKQRRRAAFLASWSEKFPGGVVPRTKVGEATGGILTSKTLSNRDSLGTGVVESFRICGKIVYSQESLADFMFGKDTEDSDSYE